MWWKRKFLMITFTQKERDGGVHTYTKKKTERNVKKGNHNNLKHKIVLQKSNKR